LSFERVDGHEALVLPDFFGYAGVPVLDADENSISVVKPGVTDVEWPTWVPEWRPGPSSDVSCRELAGYLLNHVFERVIREVT
jgi:hypothetical protein